MPDRKRQISGIKIKQVFLILIITGFVALIIGNLSMFIPSLLGALTLYIVTRSLNFKFQEEKGWKPAVSAMVFILLCLVILILPVYGIIDMVISNLGETDDYMKKFNVFLVRIREFLKEQLNIDVLNEQNIAKIKNFATDFSTSALSGTLNTLSVILSMFFMLYFMLEKPRTFERLVSSAMPLKRANISMIGEKFRKLVIANAVGLPVVALGQGIIALIGYLIFGAPSPVLLFVLTAITSMIPIIGASIIFVPVGIFMIAEGDMFGGVGVLLYSMIIVGVTDNVLRFTLLKRLENIHPLNTVFGIIMGMKLFGFMGLIFGPILVSMTVMLIQVYRDEFSDDDTPELKLPEPKELEQKIDLTI